MRLHAPIGVLFALSAAACDAPPAHHPTPVVRSTPVVFAQAECPGGLLCEATEPVDGWRVPQICQPTRLGQRVQTCWMQGLEWQRLTEFFQSRYPHATQNGALLRIAGLAPPSEITPTQPQPTPPLLLAHQRPQGVELVLLAGDPVDTPRPATETVPAIPALPRRAP